MNKQVTENETKSVETQGVAGELARGRHRKARLREDHKAPDVLAGVEWLMPERRGKERRQESWTEGLR